jgi:hypothetical protein
VTVHSFAVDRHHLRNKACSPLGKAATLNVATFLLSCVVRLVVSKQSTCVPVRAWQSTGPGPKLSTACSATAWRV